MSNLQKNMKIVVVGDGTVGKTSLILAQTANTYFTEYVPTVASNTDTHITVDDNGYNIQVWDTAGSEGYERLRALSYKNPEPQCFLLCFSVDNKSSYENIDSKWHKEVNHFCPTVPIVLVGTKTDLRGTKNCLLQADGEKLRKKINAATYTECSSKLDYNIIEVFSEAVRASLKNPIHRRRARCVLL